MTKSYPQSPVIAPKISSPASVFSQVRTEADNRLHHTVTGFNRLPHTIAQGRAPVPKVTISNDLAATIEAYQPKPGRQMAKTMNLDVQSTPPPRVDSVIDAIQRYLDIRPRREPTSDPKDEASIARHPQQIVESASRWAADRYQFANNGVALQQYRPENTAWGGSLNMTLRNEGSAGLAATPSRSPWVGPPLTASASALGTNPVHDPVDAAQAAMGQMLEMQAPKPQYLTAGPGNMVDDPARNPAVIVQNAISEMGRDLAPSTMEFVNVGVPNQTANPDQAPAFMLHDAMSEMARNMAPSGLEFSRVGVPNPVDNPALSPSYISETTVAKTRQNLEREPLPQYNVGAPNQVNNPELSPSFMAETAVSQTRQNLEKEPLPHYKVGVPNPVDNPKLAPPYIAETTMSGMQERLEREPLPQYKVGVPNPVDNPKLAPPYIAETTMSGMQERLEREPLPQYNAGAPNMVESVQGRPQEAWFASTQVAYGLGQQNGIRQNLAASFLPMAEKDAYQRAMHIMAGARPVIGGRV
ncbi:MAG: hypothetical protein LBV79_09815 [Candidatus Adiutrix sp.]|jgi:hypothetical protein|nr:hypothetical protein [Candidatus Adiutrix sp.]